MQVLHEQSLRQNRALLATIVLSFLMLLGSAWLTFHVSRQGIEADELVVHTLEVQRALNATLLTLGGAESVPILEVSDDGVGWHDKHSQEAGGLGAKIIEMVSRQFGGRPERSARFHEGAVAEGRRPGTRIRVNLARLQVMPAG